MANKDIKARTPKQNTRILSRLYKRAKDYTKNNPGNEYQIEGMKIIRTKGIRPHKKSKKASPEQRAMDALTKDYAKGAVK